MKHFKIFLVEDDLWYNKLLRHHLSLNPDYEIFTFTTGNDCIKNLHLQPDLVCIDYVLPDMFGDQLLQKIKDFNASTPVIVISGQEEIAVAISLLKSGADNYIVKDDNTKELLWNEVIKIREKTNLIQEVEVLKNKLQTHFSFDKLIIGQSPAIKKTFSLMEKSLQSNINVYISGETGTGKELVANAIHYNGTRKQKSFVAVNMSAIPSELVESELFGFEKGAFTGANYRKIGKFEEAHQGTLFLDEIAELNLTLQSKILRALQEREITRVGGNEKIKIDIRLITATHKNLIQEVEKGNFREDLYYRILGLPIHLPPLRERDNDILILAKYFMNRFSEENKLSSLSLSQNALNKLLNYNFPGNIRELKAIIDLACVLSDDKEIDAQHLQLNSAFEVQNKIALQEKSLKDYTAEIINTFMEHYDYNVLKVAEKLEIGKSTIYNLIKSGEVFLKK